MVESDNNKNLGNKERNDEFESLLKEFDKGVVEIKEGENINATIISREDDIFYLDLGGTFEGDIPCEEFLDPDSLIAGDKVEVYVLNKRKGFYRCTTSRSSFPTDMVGKNTEIESKIQSGDSVRGKITGVNKGGYEVLVEGEKGFCPFSQIESGYSEDPDFLVDKILSFKIIEFNPEEDKLVLGRREIIEEEKNSNKLKLIKSLNKGDVRKGVVSTVKNYGAFLDIGGIEGLLHISEISNEKLDDATQVLAEGDEIEVTIKDIDYENQKISLSRKSLLEDPWEKFLKKFSEGDKVNGTVATLKPYGAFIDIIPGVSGLLHVSKLGDDKFHRHSKEVFNVGDNVDVWIEKIDRSDKKIGLTKITPGIDLSEQLAKIKKESDMEEKASSESAFGQLLDNALSIGKKGE